MKTRLQSIWREDLLLFHLSEKSGSTSANEHIAKIAALPRGINILLFLQPLLALIKCWEAATSAICPHVGCKFVWKVHSEKNNVKMYLFYNFLKNNNT